MTYDLKPAVPVDWNWIISERKRLDSLAESERAGCESGEASQETLDRIMALEAIAEADATIQLARFS